MESLLNRPVEIEISNYTRTITLRNPRTLYVRERCSKLPQPELSPGSSDTCSLSGEVVNPGMSWPTGVLGILIYEAESFTLDIKFFNFIDHDQFSMDLGLKLSPGKAHLGDLGTLYTPMANGISSSFCQDIKSARVIVMAGSHGTAQVSHGPVKVTATMSPETSSRIWVVLEEERRCEEEERRSEEEDWGENAWDVQGDRSRRSEETGSRETVQDLYPDLK